LRFPRRGNIPHPDSKESWFRRPLTQRVEIEPVIGHLDCDRLMNRCGYRGATGDTVNVDWAMLAWNAKKIIRLARVMKMAMDGNLSVL
jgi:hypothetical protein